MDGAGALLARCPAAGLGVTVCAAAAGLLLYRIARRYGPEGAAGGGRMRARRREGSGRKA